VIVQSYCGLWFLCSFSAPAWLMNAAPGEKPFPSAARAAIVGAKIAVGSGIEWGGVVRPGHSPLTFLACNKDIRHCWTPENWINI